MNKQKIFILIILISLMSKIVLFSDINSLENSHAAPVDDPVAQWSATHGSTLTGPEAPLTVSWTGGDNDIINNTLEISKGYAQIDIKGAFLTKNEPDQVIQIHIDLPGYYYCELSWNDSITDLDAYVSSSASFDDSVFKYYREMAITDYPEKGFAEFEEGDYWVRIDWWDGNFPVNYRFFIGSSDYFYWNSTVDGSNQIVNTGFLKDSTYRFTSTCFDSAGNNFSSSINLLTFNQFTPEIQWIKYNNFLSSSGEIKRGSDLVIEWLATDQNVNETIFATMYFRKPGASTYSLLFSSWVSNSYTINWQSYKFDENGIYRFRIEVNNQNEPPSLPTLFNFSIIEEITTSNNNETDSTGNSTSESYTISLGSSFFTTMIILSILPIILRRKNK